MTEIVQTISRIRRAMPRNADVMLICDELEKTMSERATSVPKSKLTRAEIQRNYRLRKKASK